MAICRKCEENLRGSYGEYYCYKCKNELAGFKPRKHRNLCIGCTQDFYNNKYRDTKNVSGTKGCMSYTSHSVKLKYVYYSSSQVVPNVAWKLECFNYKRN